MTDNFWKVSRGWLDRYPTLWLCSHCAYHYWSHGPEEDPRGDGHCGDGYWLADNLAIDRIANDD